MDSSKGPHELCALQLRYSGKSKKALDEQLQFSSASKRGISVKIFIAVEHDIGRTDYLE